MSENATEIHSASLVSNTETPVSLHQSKCRL